MIDFDDMMGNTEDDPRDPRVPIVGGLIVAERPRHGDFLNVEAEAFRETAALPFMIFIEEDPDTGAAIFANAQEFADAMHLAPGCLPTEEEASAWHIERAAAAFDRWRDRLAAAWAKDEQR